MTWKCRAHRRITHDLSRNRNTQHAEPLRTNSVVDQGSVRRGLTCRGGSWSTILKVTRALGIRLDLHTVASTAKATV